MGFFSFKISEKGKSIPNSFSGQNMLTVHMVAPDGRTWTEPNYEGYGVFGGKDYYQLLAELNGLKTIDDGINLDFDKKAKGTIFPRFTETKNIPYKALLDPVRCPDQGYFYPQPKQEITK